MSTLWQTNMLGVTLLYFSLLFVSASVLGNDSNFLFNSERFPTEPAVPTLANGNLGFVAHSDSVFLNGVYNGRGLQSHRARIPNYARLQLVQCANIETNPPYCTYQLDLKFGRFRTVYDDPNRQLRLIHEVYPHRFYDHAIVNRFRIQRLNGEGVVQVMIQQDPGEPSEDIEFQPTQNQVIDGHMVLFQCGRTKQVEDPMIQPAGMQVCVFFTNVPSILQMEGDRTSQDYFFYTVFARSETVAVQELRMLMSVNPELSHITQMQAMWDRYGIGVEGNDALDRALKSSAFTLFSNVPSPVTAQPDVFQWYGISPSGLGRGGGSSQGFQGHNMWDMDIWIFPTILLVDPDAALKLLEYRSVILRNSLDINAVYNGFEGWQYPWASAFTGREVSPSAEAAALQHHITGDVAFAARQYLLATDDMSWMLTNGCELAYETAKFWKSRAVYNPDTDKFDIRSVTGPDEIHRNVTNDVYTNVIAAHNLFFGEFAGCMCRSTLKLQENEWHELTKIAKSLQLLYDPTKDYHPQFEGYTLGNRIGQADAVLLSYPLIFPMNDETKRHNLEIYQAAVVPNGPAVTWPIHTIGWLELGELNLAAETFRKSYNEYLRPPFNVWNMMPMDFAGGSNFVTGAGGFLQAVLNGYGGIRLSIDSFTINKPRLPPGTTRFFVPEITYMTRKFSLEVLPDKFAVVFKAVSTSPNLSLFIDEVEYTLCDTCVVYGKNSLRLQLVQSEPIANDCVLEVTTMNMKLGDQNGSASIISSAHLMVYIPIMVRYIFTSRT
ncbi:protein-glucosylgalactosylhydroxylysine glucosidase-like [Topomyia yanbarensis]|uniref:protein-glucosylgalactosylhydroxylysine glucosidase-like n=1 Tax=Topomyia yanbarensis TaxID=2498891 RepID=UPI00273C0AE3|nr:protein-glucosylgalactosylhydroxylysine glucosidase-like [Topomyia yanbarensis]